MPAPARLVTLTQAKAQLNITLPPGDPGDVEIQDKLDEAEEIILRYLKGANGEAINWVDPVTAPGNVTSAIKLMLTHLYQHRGDDEEKTEDLWTAIHFMLVIYRTPALA